MQSVQEFKTPLRHEQSVAPLRVTIVQPSLWKQMKAKVAQTLTTETIAEIVLRAATVLLTTGLFVSLARALEHYTIIPLP